METFVGGPRTIQLAAHCPAATLSRGAADVSSLPWHGGTFTRVRDT